MTPDQLTLVIGGALTLGLIVLLFAGDSAPSGAMKKRLARVSGTAAPKAAKTTSAQSLRRRTSDSDIPLVDKLIKATMPNPEKMRERLERTGKSITLGAYLMINALAVLLFFLIFSQFLHWSSPVSFFMAIATGLYLPHRITGRMGDKRVNKFLANFPEAIDTICRGLRSGLPITETINAVGNELPEPLGIEFRRIADGVRMGRTLEDSMWDVARRLDTPEFRFFIIALAIQRETGGNLAETLGNLADMLRKRRQLRLKIRAMSSEARASAMIIGSLPFIMFGLLMAVNSDYMMVLLTETRGKILLGGGGTWLGLGVLTMKQMINFEI